MVFLLINDFYLLQFFDRVFNFFKKLFHKFFMIFSGNRDIRFVVCSVPRRSDSVAILDQNEKIVYLFQLLYIHVGQIRLTKNINVGIKYLENTISYVNSYYCTTNVLYLYKILFYN